MWALRKHIYTEYIYIYVIFICWSSYYMLWFGNQEEESEFLSLLESNCQEPLNMNLPWWALVVRCEYTHISLYHMYLCTSIYCTYSYVCVYGIVFINSCMFIQHYTCMRACCAFLVNSPTWYGPPKPLSRFVVVAVLVLQLRILVLVVLLVQ